MNLNFLKKWLSPVVWNRGRAYHLDGRAVFDAVEGRAVLYQVRGTQPYLVKLLLNEDSNAIVNATCTCPVHGGCKHIAAAALSLSEQPDRLPRPVPGPLALMLARPGNLAPLSGFLEKYDIPGDLRAAFLETPPAGAVALLDHLFGRDAALPADFLHDFKHGVRFEDKRIKDWMVKVFHQWNRTRRTSDAERQRERRKRVEHNVRVYDRFIQSLGLPGLENQAHREEIQPLEILLPAVFIRRDRDGTRDNLFDGTYSMQLLFRSGEDRFGIIDRPDKFLDDIGRTGVFESGRERYRVPPETLGDPMLLRVVRHFAELEAGRDAYMRRPVRAHSFNTLYNLCRDGLTCFLNERKRPLKASPETASVVVRLDFDGRRLLVEWTLIAGGHPVPETAPLALLPGQPAILVSQEVMHPFAHPSLITLLKNLQTAAPGVRTSFELRRFHQSAVLPALPILPVTWNPGYEEALGSAAAFSAIVSFDQSGAWLPLVSVEFEYDGRIHRPLLTRTAEERFDPNEAAKSEFRDFRGEHEFLEIVLRAFRLADDGTLRLRPDSEEAAAELAFLTLPAHPQVKQVRRSDSFARSLKAILPEVSVKVEPAGVDFLDVSLSLGGGTLPEDVPTIMSALKAGRKTLRLRDGSILLLNTDDFKEVFALVDALEGREGLEEGKAVRLSRADMLYLGRRLGETNAVPGGLRNEISSRLASFDAYEPPETPAGLTGTLRGYQLTGFHWLHKMSLHGFHAILADDMGLGKTVQTIALLLKHYEGAAGKSLPPSLIVCPATLVYNWMAEFAKFAPRFPVAALYGLKNEREARFKDSKVRVFVTSYTIVQRDIEAFEKTPFLFAVLDEAHKIKNRNTQTFKCCRVIEAGHRLALTGTPVENRTEDLFSIFEFLEPGFLALYRTSGEIGASVNRALKNRIAPFILRRLKSQVLDDLPAKTEQIMMCELDEKQKKLYLALREKASAEAATLIKEKGLNKSKIHILALLTRLKQVCCHPLLIDARKGAAIPSAKLDLLLELLEEARDGGHRVLVFSQFTSMLSIIRDRLTEDNIPFLYMDGETKDRIELTQRFNADGSIPCFLISLKTGGHGLNLTGADTVIHYDQWWNPAVEAQATDRVHRIGQTKAVTVYKLICKETIEEKILELQNKKKELFADLIDDNTAPQSLTAKDISEMLGV